jgi:hypothetical protein
VHWLVLAALGDALIAILGCAGLLAGVWFMARGSDAGVGLSVAPSAPPAPAPAPAPEPPDPPARTTFRHGPIRLVGESATAGPPAPGPALAAVSPEPEPGLETEPEPAPSPPAHLPPPVPQAPRTSFRQGPIRLGGIEHGIRGSGDEPPDAA